MSIVGAFDVHRRQLTFEYLDTVTGELRHGRVLPADREHLRQWLSRFAGHGEVQFALEGCTGWRYVVEELCRAGIRAHLAEPADTAALRGRKRHAKTDKTDARHLRVHLMAGDLPACWIPPEHVLEARATVRLYKDLLDERGAWHQRIAATLFHQGVPAIGSVATPAGRAAVAEVELSAAGRQAVQAGLRQIDRLTAELDPLRRQLGMLSRRQPGCRALRTTQFGVGTVTSVAIWAELGDVRRFANSGNAVRHTGLDITVYSSAPNARPVTYRGRDPNCSAGRCTNRPSPLPNAPARTTATTPRPGTGATPGWPPCRRPASSPAAATTPCVNSGRRRSSQPREPGRPAPRRRAHEPMTCGQLLPFACCQAPAWTASKE